MKTSKPTIIGYTATKRGELIGEGGFTLEDFTAELRDNPAGLKLEPIILLRDYEALQAEHRILESELTTVKKVAYGNMDLLNECEKLRNILSQVAEAVGGYADPSCSLEFMEEIPKEVESVVQRLAQDLVESRANDRQAMYYLNQVREIVGGDDFPDMVEKCRELIK